MERDFRDSCIFGERTEDLVEHRNRDTDIRKEEGMEVLGVADEGGEGIPSLLRNSTSRYQLPYESLRGRSKRNTLT